ncbi:Putative patch repair protein [Dokdonella koreensis DS-123]|uniref:Patch repair protein n=1 Tax=Dokdonella koreensis DS-123 TaxID=1300342 RepID=A0A161HJN5_9GAMM|nr:Putative patch repair protein [Dokdonella koreensis DS-123]
MRDAVRRLSVRFTTDNTDLPGSPDLANRRRHFAIFVHGCFWHRHANCARATTPSSNREFWSNKFKANARRDRRVVRALRRLGFKVMVIWECRTRDPVALTGRIRRFFDS